MHAIQKGPPNSNHVVRRRSCAHHLPFQYQDAKKFPLKYLRKCETHKKHLSKVIIQKRRKRLAGKCFFLLALSKKSRFMAQTENSRVLACCNAHSIRFFLLFCGRWIKRKLTEYHGINYIWWLEWIFEILIVKIYGRFWMKFVMHIWLNLAINSNSSFNSNYSRLSTWKNVFSNR